jgi:uncharacterized protein (TIGR00369 family)
MDASSKEDRAWWQDMEGRYGDSPIHAALGLKLEVVEAGKVIVHYDGVATAGNLRGNVAGGSLAEMIDSAVVQACRTRAGREVGTVTVELKVNYVRGAATGGALTTAGHVEHLGRTTAVGQARTTDVAGRLIALGTVTVALLRKEA